jgi:hypothetical protein
MWQNAKEDLKDSWQFRIWLLLWIIIGSLMIAGMVAFSASQSASRTDQSVNLVNATSITFPNFRFRFTDKNTKSKIDYPSSFCSTSLASNTNLTATQCTQMSSQCIKVTGSVVTVSNSPLANQPIVCTIKTVSATGNPEYLTFEINDQDANSYGYGVNELGLTIPPTQNSWVTLEKSTYNGLNMWDTRYQEITWDNNPAGPQITTYIVSVWIGTFRVFSYTDNNSLTVSAVWGQSAALFGGFLYFMLVIQSIAMFIVNLFVAQDSRFLRSLNGGNSASSDSDHNTTVSSSYDSGLMNDGNKSSGKFGTSGSSAYNDTPIY